MNSLQLAHAWLDCFYGKRPLMEMADLLADGLVFEGPLYQFDSKQAYLDSLRADPPVGLDYRILDEFVREDVVCIIYQFIKPGMTTTMAQTFSVVDDKITAIRLVFDSRPFF
ncbi:MAG: nuclear transport factor 2 family protein [Gammaproteobacteria bacterium]|nr:nuclear transport factor 2 family protein [Gammaproteobacteria bacterium]MDH5651747.1 nuclear transport factor 2 family protein [Gammaproteobacteria bacterium]